MDDIQPVAQVSHLRRNPCPLYSMTGHNLKNHTDKEANREHGYDERGEGIYIIRPWARWIGGCACCLLAIGLAWLGTVTLIRSDSILKVVIGLGCMGCGVGSLTIAAIFASGLWCLVCQKGEQQEDSRFHSGTIVLKGSPFSEGYFNRYLFPRLDVTGRL
jgi:hypothetical protein